MDNKAIYQELPPADRKMQLAADAAKVRENAHFFKELSQEEIDVKNQQISGNSIKVFKLRDELKDIKSSFKDRIDPLEEETKSLCQQVDTGMEEIVGTLYDFPDYETNMMNIYNEHGELIQSRRLLPEEKQARLFVAHSRTGTE
jgi:hypothetical protein